MRRVCWAGLAAIAVLVVPALSEARVPTRLVYSRAQSARDCPSEQALVDAVAARLGYDPFSPWGDQTILATVSRRGKGLLGHAELIDHDGIAQGSREVKLEGVDCSELILALALAISITLDPLHVDAPKAEPEPEREPKQDSATSAEAVAPGPTHPVEPPAPPPATSPEAARDTASSRTTHTAHVATQTSWRVSGGAISSYGLTPQLNFGARLGLDARRERWSVALEALAALPATWSVEGGGELSASLLAVGLAPCFEVLPGARLCAVGTVGSLRSESQQVAAPRSERTLHATVGGRTSLFWPLGQRAELFASADIAAVLNRPQFQLDGLEVWRPSPVLATLGLGASLRFF